MPNFARNDTIGARQLQHSLRVDRLVYMSNGVDYPDALAVHVASKTSFRDGRSSCLMILGLADIDEHDLTHCREKQ
jgi:hypothetical protein